MRKLTLLVLLLAPALRADEPKQHLDEAAAAMKRGELDEALKHADAAVQAAPKSPAAYDLRGTINFKLARIKESLADFDRQIELDPKTAPAHWRRGLTLYYADK